MRQVFLVTKHHLDENVYVRTDPGYCGSVLFNPFDGGPATHLTNEDCEIDGEFKNIDGTWYFRYNVQGEIYYMNVLNRKFVYYISKL